MNWRLNNIKYPIYNLGEGKRIGIWIQGCTLYCKGCVNQTLWSKTGGKSINVFDVYNIITEIANEYDGLTISGGEPFQQYEQLMVFLHLIKTKTELNVYCFTGYELEELNKLYPDKLFYKYIDTLITGRYEINNNSNDNYRGSTNQILYSFESGKPVIIGNPFVSKKWSISVNKKSQIQMVGIPKWDELKKIEGDLKLIKINKKFI
jgi:anaerobic ribonucleoside-triphosphate reductase activating protein